MAKIILFWTLLVLSLGLLIGGGSSSDMEFRTVIGNIYENPELLEAK